MCGGGRLLADKLRDYAKQQRLKPEKHLYDRIIVNKDQKLRLGETGTEVKHVPCVSRKFLVRALNDPDSRIDLNPNLLRKAQGPETAKIIDRLREPIMEAVQGLHSKFPRNQREK